ncbi:MAG: riboflavin biosynthesis protein RibF [Muribaculaceae bacterium]|nr:riboflavin biosynthesis protein RibF [Muribaculaceae bacterium]
MIEKAVTIGTFDGVHRGHRLVLDTLKREASKRDLQPVAISFDRHPLELVAPERAPGNLTTTERKAELIRAEGVEPLILPFTEQLRGMRAYEWLDYIYRKYDVRLLVAGYDNTFGSDGIDMSIADYKAMGDTIGIEVISAPEEAGVSSSAVRKAVKNGDIAKALSLLGHRPELEGRVAPGFHVGHEIGFPTANLQVSPRLVVPANGVYASLAFVNGIREDMPAMVNIGYRPTFEGTSKESNQLTVEAHIIGVDDEIYGQRVRLEFLGRLRDERRFETVDELKTQLALDRENTLSMVNDITFRQIKT